MPRAHTEANEPHYDQAVYALKCDVIRRVGFDVRTVKECKILSDEIAQFDRRFPLAVSTLRRFFDLIPSDSKFSITTLNTLSRYSGKQAFSHYLDLAKAESLKNRDHTATEAFKHQKDILPNHLTGLLDLLEIAPYAAPGFDFLHQLATVVAETYRSEHGITAALTERLTNSQRLRAVVIERYPPLDCISPKDTGALIMSDYAKNSKTQQERDFAHGILAQGALFAGDLDAAHRWLRSFHGLRMNSDGDVHQQSRSCSVLWLLAMWNRQEPLQAKCLQDLRNNIAPADPTEFPAFAAAVAKQVIISGHREMISLTKDVLEQAMKQAELTLRASHALHALRLELAWLHYLTGNPNAAFEELDLLSNESFAEHEKELGLLMWSVLRGHLSANAREREEAFNEAENWAKSTGYTGLHGQLLLAAPIRTEARTMQPS